MTRLVIRADASGPLGLGHLLRCVALAEAARRRELSVLFLTNEGTPERIVADHGFASRSVEFGRAGFEALERSDIVFIDGEHFGPDIHANARSQASVVAAISDRGVGQFDVDVLVTADAFDVSGYEVSSDTYVLAGPSYQLIREEFTRRRRVRESVPRAGVVISLGGSDAYGLSIATSSAVRAVTSGPVKVLSGPMAAVAEMSDAEVIEPTSEPSAIFDSAGCVVTAGGMTAWELLAMGQACVVLPLNREQGRGCSTIETAAAAAVVWAPAASMARVGEETARLLHDDEHRRQLSRAALDLVDGVGARRVLEAVLAVRRHA